jgi:hypothetical protein
MNAKKLFLDYIRKENAKWPKHKIIFKGFPEDLDIEKLTKKELLEVVKYLHSSYEDAKNSFFKQWRIR